MSVQQRIDALRARHAELETQLVEENARPLPDSDRLHLLKREKLKIKEEMVRLESGAPAAAH